MPPHAPGGIRASMATRSGAEAMDCVMAVGHDSRSSSLCSAEMKKRILQARSALIRFVRGVVGGPGMDWTTDKALGRGSRRHQIATIVDVGASNGIWTMRARRHFPEARALLIEAQGAVHHDALEAYARRDPRINYVIAAAGDNAGDIHFEASDPFGGAAAREPFAGNDIVVPMTTIEPEVGEQGPARSLPA